ncbi:PqqD family protein [Sphingomonas sp. LB-2]|uniref:PqqD family protein n=1 Tax=Sphingomonas caeni TaxID=2984949 RepID=UPI002230A42D|nr:PqqD family protein [Sphingomonas caeni]MCW3848244.1 PqqD family protein [Sphingomonas caeni]
MSALTDTSIAARADNKVAADLGEQTVIMDIESGYYFQLNQSGAAIWGQLETPMALAEICARLKARFEVDAQTCRAEVGEFLELMRDKGLVTIR